MAILTGKAKEDFLAKVKGRPIRLQHSPNYMYFIPDGKSQGNNFFGMSYFPKDADGVEDQWNIEDGFYNEWFIDKKLEKQLKLKRNLQEWLT